MDRLLHAVRQARQALLHGFGWRWSQSSHSPAAPGTNRARCGWLQGRACSRPGHAGGLDAITQRQQARHDTRGPVTPGRGIRPGGVDRSPPGGPPMARVRGRRCAKPNARAGQGVRHGLGLGCRSGRGPRCHHPASPAHASACCRLSPHSLVSSPAPPARPGPDAHRAPPAPGDDGAPGRTPPRSIPQASTPSQRNQTSTSRQGTWQDQAAGALGAGAGTESRPKAARLRGKEGREHLSMNEFLSFLLSLLNPYFAPTLSLRFSAAQSLYPCGFCIFWAACPYIPTENDAQNAESGPIEPLSPGVGPAVRPS